MIRGQASIQTLLGGLLKNRHMVASMRRVMVMSLWDKVVGHLLAEKSWPERVTDGVLTVGVSTHAWAEELHLLKPQILARYRQLLGRSALKDVEFRVGRRKSRKDDEANLSTSLHSTPEEPIVQQPVPGEVLAGISNPEVRELLAPLFSRLRAEREWKREHGWARCGECLRVYHGSACPYCASAKPVA